MIAENQLYMQLDESKKLTQIAGKNINWNRYNINRPSYNYRRPKKRF